MSPILSIIIPVYNAEQYLPACLKSITEQTFTDYEVILVDDGSNDGSGRLCDALAAEHDGVRTYHQLNQGVSAARNHGLREARGTWVMFVDADDALYADNSLECVMQEATADVDMVVGGCVKVDAAGKEITDNSKTEQQTMDALTYARCLLNSTYGYQGFVWSKLFRRDLILKGKVTFDETLYFCEDQHFVVQYLCVPDVSHIRFDNGLKDYKYFVRSGSAMASLSRGYNPKFFTDFLAYQKMAVLLCARFNDSHVNEMAENNCMGSGYRILGVMQINHVSHNEQKEYISEELRKRDSLNEFECKCQRASIVALREMLGNSSNNEKAEVVYRWMHSSDCRFRYLNVKWKLLYVLSIIMGRRGLALVGNRI